MKIAVYGKSFSEESTAAVQKIFDSLRQHGCETVVYEPFHAFLRPRITLSDEVSTFNRSNAFINGASCCLSIGGDGTFLDAVTLACESDIPLVGINAGRLGFLATVSLDYALNAVDSIIKQDFSVEKRTLLKVDTSENIFGNQNFALNELTVHKKDSSSMITIHTYVNNKFLNSFWADGLIVATPTGSTAYSLSCGGPIVSPDTKNFILTPIAPHNLNVRPMVVSDDVEIKLIVEGRSDNFMATLDSRSATIAAETELVIRKSQKSVRFINFENQHFFKTIRNKMMWGIDKRN